MSDWKEYKLSEVAELTVGFVGSMTNEYVESGVPFLRSKNVNPFSINYSDLKFISEEFHKKIEKSTLSPGDVVIVRTGKPGTSCVIPPDLKNANCSDLVIVRPGPKLESYYFSYFMNSIGGNHVSAHLVGAVQQHFNVKSAKDLKLTLPPLSEQKAIAHILGTLDEKIELNRQMNQTLEAMAQALFKSWFVDFDPVIDNAIQAGNDIPEELQAKAEKRKGLSNSKKLLSTNPSLAAQFPDSFVFNETLGKWVPKGWEVKSILMSCKKIQNGGTPSRSNDLYWEDGKIPWLSSGEVRQALITRTKEKITDLGLKNSSAKMVPRYSTVVAMYGATAGQVSFLGTQTTTNQAICSLLPKPGFEFFNYVKLTFSKDILENQARGSAQQNISKGIIEKLEVIYPTTELSIRFNNLVRPHFLKRIEIDKEIETLTQLRDRLLPELISGKIRVNIKGNIK